MGRVFTAGVLAAFACSHDVIPRVAAADSLPIDTHDNILKSSRTIADSLVDIYNSGDKADHIPGLLPQDDYYFWEAGAFWGALIDYWRLTDDDNFNTAIQEGLLFQRGDDDDYMPMNQTKSLGNDDQCYWALAAMQAAEYKFPSPPQDKPQWLELAKNVYDEQVSRISTDKDECGGGLRWQIFTFNNGYNYKNSISNGCLLNLGARLARYTGNSTFSDTAAQLYDWMESAKFLDSKTGAVHDGADVSKNCETVNKVPISTNVAVIANGAAYMYNQTTGDASEKWRTRVEKHLKNILKTFFHDDIPVEVACEKAETCNTDQLAYKGITIRWLASISQLAPFTADTILPVLKKSAQAAADSCPNGECSFSWTKDKSSEEKGGAGEQMNALAAVSNLLIADVAAPVKASESGSNGSSDEANSTEPSSASPSETSSGDDKGAGRMAMDNLSLALLSLGLLASSWVVLGH